MAGFMQVPTLLYFQCGGNLEVQGEKNNIVLGE